MDDLIRRQAAIDALGDGALVNYQAAGHNNGLVKAIDVIKGLPTAQPEQQWIPCSERLPEDIKPVIVTWKNTDPKSYYQYIIGKHFIGTGHYCNGKWFWYSSTCEDFLAEYGRCDVDEMDEAIEVIAWR